MPGSEQSNPSPQPQLREHEAGSRARKQASNQPARTLAAVRGRPGEGIMRRAGAVGSASCGGEGEMAVPGTGAPTAALHACPPCLPGAIDAPLWTDAGRK